MKAASTHRAIQAFKASNSATYNSVNYAHVIAIYLYDASKLGLLKKTIFSLFFTPRILITPKAGKSALFFYSCRKKRRPDYDHIAGYVHKTIEDIADYAEAEESFSLRQFFQTLSKIPSSVKLANGFNSSIISRIGAVILIAKFLSAERKLLSLLPDRSRLVTFCDAQPLENFITQLANARAVETITNQHGQYRLLSDLNISPDAEAYENFLSKKMLCWGEATRHEFKRAGFSSERLIVTGWIRKKPQNLQLKNNTGLFGVMLNGTNASLSNGNLINAANKISEELGMRYLVRIHPADNEKKYIKLTNKNCISICKLKLDEYLTSVEFSIGHMSGAVIEVLDAKAPIYLLDDGLLAEVFRLPGLCHPDTDHILSFISMDKKAEDFGQARLSKYKKWFNDDFDQQNRIRKAIIKEAQF